MRQFLKRINFLKYRLLYTYVLGGLSYCCLVLHFAVVYWDEEGGALAPEHLPSLILGVILGVLFLAAAGVCLSVKERKSEEVLDAQKGIIYGYLKLKLRPRLKYADGTVTGELLVYNKGKAVVDLSSGEYPVNIGISIVDDTQTVLDQNYARLAIRCNGVLNHGERISLPVAINGLEEYAQKNCQLAFTPVQEKVSWARSSSVYFPLV